MIEFVVFKTKYTKNARTDSYEVDLVPVITVTARSAADAIRIGKQKGIVSPIVEARHVA